MAWTSAIFQHSTEKKKTTKQEEHDKKMAKAEKIARNAESAQRYAKGMHYK